MLVDWLRMGKIFEMISLLKGLSRIIRVSMKKINYSIKAKSYKKKGILGMNFSPNSLQPPNNQQFGQSFNVKNIFRPYPLITDRDLQPLTECVNHLVQEGVLFFPRKFCPPTQFNAFTKVWKSVMAKVVDFRVKVS